MTDGSFFAMGGYAFYVWTSFGICLVVLVGNVLTARARERRALANVRDQAAERPQ